MQWVQVMRSPRLSLALTAVSLILAAVALMSSYWCVGKQKVPKPLCSAIKHSNCTPVPGMSDADIHFSWDTGDDRFVFPTFHIGLFTCCEENIYTDAWEEKCRGFHTMTPSSEKAMLWLSLAMEITYVSLLCISCVLLSLQLCLTTWFPSVRRWGQLLNSFAAIFTVLGGLLGMVAHMMFMQVVQIIALMGPDGFKPHSYGYSYAFYIAWLAFIVCMTAGVSTLNNYTKNVLMVGPRFYFGLNPFSFNYAGPPPPAPYYTPPNPAITPDYPMSPPPLSHLSPYYDPPTPPFPPSSPRLKHSYSLPLPHSDSLYLPLPHSDSFPPVPSHPSPSSPFHRLSLPSPDARLPLPGNKETISPHCYPEEEYSPL